MIINIQNNTDTRMYDAGLLVQIWTTTKIETYDHVSHKLICTATEAGQNLEAVDFSKNTYYTVYRQRTLKV